MTLHCNETSASFLARGGRAAAGVEIFQTFTLSFSQLSLLHAAAVDTACVTRVCVFRISGAWICSNFAPKKEEDKFLSHSL